MGVDRAAAFSGAAQIKMLAVSRGPPSLSKPRRHRFCVDGICQTRECCTKRVLAHVPGLHSEQRPSGSNAANIRHARQTEIGRFSDKRSKERPFIAGRHPRGHMSEVIDKARPFGDLRQDISDPDCRQCAIGARGEQFGRVALKVVNLRPLRESELVASEQQRIFARQPICRFKQSGIELCRLLRDPFVSGQPWYRR